MTELCFTIFISALCYDAMRIILKKMELSYLDRKNAKEGRYIN